MTWEFGTRKIHEVRGLLARVGVEYDGMVMVENAPDQGIFGIFLVDTTNDWKGSVLKGHMQRD